MKRKIFLVIIACISILNSGTKVLAQIDAQFASNMFTKQLINPASYGESEMANAFGNWRRQWKNFGPVTYAGYIDTPLKGQKRKHGLGMSFIGDNAGLFKTTTVNVAYSHKQQVWKGTLSIGAQTSFLNLVFDGTGINTPTTDYHNNLGYPTISSETTGIKFDMAIGAHYSTKNEYYGISLTHLNRPTLELDDVGAYIYYNRTLHLYGGYDFKIKSLPELTLKPCLFIKTDGKVTQFDMNCNAWYKDSMYAGLSYRLQDAVVLLGGFKLKNGILVGGAYDITTSRMGYAGFGSTEIFFNYEFSLSLQSKTNKYKSIRIL